MNNISITTSQNIELEFELASVGDRILGFLIDMLIIAAYVIILFISFNLLSLLGKNVWLILLIAAPVFFYSLLCEVLMNGQSVGKRVMNTKVISLTGEQASFSQYLIRWLFRIIDFSIFSGLVALITVVLTDKRQRVGDRVAGTVIVKTKPRTDFSQTIYTATPLYNYQVTYPEVSNLRDNDIQLVKEVIQTVQRSGNTMLALQAQQKIEQVLSIRSRNVESLHFLHTILADYNYVTAEM